MKRNTTQALFLLFLALFSSCHQKFAISNRTQRTENESKKINKIQPVKYCVKPKHAKQVVGNWIRKKNISRWVKDINGIVGNYFGLQCFACGGSLGFNDLICGSCKQNLETNQPLNYHNIYCSNLIRTHLDHYLRDTWKGVAYLRNTSKGLLMSTYNRELILQLPDMKENSGYSNNFESCLSNFMSSLESPDEFIIPLYNRLKRVDLNTKSLREISKTGIIKGMENDRITSAIRLKNGKFVIGCASGSIKYVDKRGNIIYSFKPHLGKVSRLVHLPTSGKFLSAGMNGEVRLYDLNAWKPLDTVYASVGSINDMIYLNRLSTVVMGGKYGLSSVRLTDFKNFGKLTFITSNRTFSLALLPNGTDFVAGGFGDMKFWSLKNQRFARLIQTITVGVQPIWCFDVSSCGNRIATGSDDGYVRVYTSLN